MTISYSQPPIQIEYPDEDGKPMAESDQARNYLLYGVEVLRMYFRERADVYVSVNLFIYYEEGNPYSVISPDVFVAFGVEKRDRRSYKTWEEGDKTPDFVLEITSKSTRSQDQGAKKGIYSFLGVREYFQYDPTGDYLNPRLQGLHLVEANYFPCSTTVLPDDITSIFSEVLGLELRLLPSGELRLYDPVTGKTLLTYEESEQARIEAEQRAKLAEARIAELEAHLRALEDR